MLIRDRVEDSFTVLDLVIKAAQGIIFQPIDSVHLLHDQFAIGMDGDSPSRVSGSKIQAFDQGTVFGLVVRAMPDAFRKLVQQPIQFITDDDPY
jgi:hypothetical protein